MIKYSDKNKLYNIELQEKNDTNNNIRIIDNSNKTINQNVKDVNLTQDIFNKNKDLSQEWLACTKVYNLAQANPIWTGEQIAEWNIYLGIFDIRFLPFLKMDIIYQLISDSIIMDEIVFLKNIFFELKDSGGQEYVKDITLHAGMYFYANDILKEMNPVEVKLMMIWDVIPLVKEQIDNKDITNFDISQMILPGWPNGKPFITNPVWPAVGGGGGPAG